MGYFQSQKNYFQARKDLASARYDYILNVFKLLQLTGTLSKTDLNDYNVLVDEGNVKSKLGVIDFGDMLHSKTIYDLAICLAKTGQLGEASGTWAR